MSIPHNKTLIDLLDTSSKANAGKTALSWTDGGAITYNQLYKNSYLLAAYLQNSGVAKGDKIILLAENSPQWMLVFFAIERCGAVAVPILPEFHRNEIENIIEHSEACCAFVSDKLKENISTEKTGGVKKLFVVEELPIVADRQKTNSDTTKEIAAFFDSNKDTAFSFPKLSPDDLASIIYTSGTTGSSKGVMLSHRNIYANCLMGASLQEIDATDRFLSILPLSHTLEFTIGGMFPILRGATIYYLKKPPVAANLLPALAKVRPTFMLTVPLIIEKIYHHKILPTFNNSIFLSKAYKLAPLRTLLNKMAVKKLKKTFGGEMKFFGIGGAKLSPEVEQFLKSGGFPYAIGYGLTETAPLIAGAVPGKTRMQSTGFIVKGMEARVHNPDLATGEGEIEVKGANVMMGYYKNEEETNKVFTSDGWFKTGDLGCFDKDNYLYIKGRLKNMIVGPSGENIYPEAIEEQINNIEGVLESVVYELKGKLVARIHLNYDEVGAKIEALKEKAHNKQLEIEDILNEIKQKVNLRVNKFSRLNLVIEQTQPFERTPTRKIKRYLYTEC